jgi:hypothetical protein
VLVVVVVLGLPVRKAIEHDDEDEDDKEAAGFFLIVLVVVVVLGLPGEESQSSNRVRWTTTRTIICAEGI